MPVTPSPLKSQVSSVHSCCIISEVRSLLEEPCMCACPLQSLCNCCVIVIIKCGNYLSCVLHFSGCSATCYLLSNKQCIHTYYIHATLHDAPLEVSADGYAEMWVEYVMYGILQRPNIQCYPKVTTGHRRHIPVGGASYTGFHEYHAIQQGVSTCLWGVR